MKPVRKTDSGRRKTSSNDTQTLGILFGATILDTTWRVFVPCIAGVGVGFWIDLTQRGTRPWATIAGLAIGFIVAGVLVKMQLDNVRRHHA